MRQEKNIIECPNCGEEIDVNDILYHQLDEQLKKQYKGQLAKEKEKYDNQASKLKEDRIKLEAEKSKQLEHVEKQVSEEVKLREIALREKIKTEAEEEQSDALSSLRKDLDEKSTKIKELNKASIELEKVKREMGEQLPRVVLRQARGSNHTVNTEIWCWLPGETEGPDEAAPR